MHMVFPRTAHASARLPAVSIPLLRLLALMLHRTRWRLSVYLHMCVCVCVCFSLQRWGGVCLREQKRRKRVVPWEGAEMHYISAVRVHMRTAAGINGLHNQDLISQANIKTLRGSQWRICLPTTHEENKDQLFTDEWKIYLFSFTKYFDAKFS